MKQTPGAVAVVCGHEQISYRELNRRANQLAGELCKLGAGPEVCVGICAGRSLDLVVALLAILKAGGAYVPLDPGLPAERLEFMLRDAQVQVVLTQHKLMAAIPPDPGVTVVCIDREENESRYESEDDRAGKVGPGNLAYVMYTSGSTGQPKGVAIEHRNAVAFLSWVHSAFTREELAGVMASTSISFDLSVFEIFAPLTCGGTVIMAENALALSTIPDPSRVTLLNTVPSAMTELLRLNAIPASVQVINLAGELLQPDLVRRLYGTTSVRKVQDLYGPSECTTYSTWALRTADGPSTIGRPIANTQVYIADAHLNMVPIGVRGEIYIGGDGVARGYLNRPELTAEKFILHSFDGEPARRFYRTGDLARYRADGNIEFLGRSDNQVKLRGYRIELGEIESVLMQHDAVREAVVILKDDEAGDKQIAAYVVPDRHRPAPGELRNYLKTRLPGYMVPAAFIFLDALPLTPNGKVDRAALPDPDCNPAGSADAGGAPRSPLEAKIAAIWSEVLGINRIGVHDNFFDFGGHSLKATKAVSRLRLAFQSEIPLRYVFEFPTIAELAAAIGGDGSTPCADPRNMEMLLTEIETIPEEEARKLLARETNE